MNIHVLPAGPIQTNALFVSAPELQERCSSTPRRNWEEIEPLLTRKMHPRELWLTHGHWDHTQGGAEAGGDQGPGARASDDRILIETPESWKSFLIPGLRPVR